MANMEKKASGVIYNHNVSIKLKDKFYRIVIHPDYTIW